MQHSNNEKYDLVKKCIETLYMRYRKSVPAYIDQEAKIATKDLFEFQLDEIPAMFSYACKMHALSTPPLTAQIIKLWKEAGKHKEKLNFAKCDLCSSTGYVSVELENNKGKFVSLRCNCTIGDQCNSSVLRYQPGKKLYDKYIKNNSLNR